MFKNCFFLLVVSIFVIFVTACSANNDIPVANKESETATVSTAKNETLSEPTASYSSPDVSSSPDVFKEKSSPSVLNETDGQGSLEKGFFDIQESVNNGHQPWRINPKEVAMEFAYGTLKLKGTAVLSRHDEKESARVTFTKEDGVEIHIDLYQPATKGNGGIWEVEHWFDENNKQYQIRDLAALPPMFYNDENVPQNVREAVRNAVVKEWTDAFGIYYNVLGFYSSNVSYFAENDTAEVEFTMTMVTQNFYKDPDTVGYIKEAKDNGSESYKQLYDEYNMPHIGNFRLKVTMSLNSSGGALPGTIQFFHDISFSGGAEYVPAKADDFILKE